MHARPPRGTRSLTSAQLGLGGRARRYTSAKKKSVPAPLSHTAVSDAGLHSLLAAPRGTHPVHCAPGALAAAESPETPRAIRPPCANAAVEGLWHRTGPDRHLTPAHHTAARLSHLAPLASPQQRTNRAYPRKSSFEVMFEHGPHVQGKAAKKKKKV